MTRIVKRLGVFAIVLAAVVLVLRLMFPLPDISQRTAITAIPSDPDTRLGALMQRGLQRHPEKSGVVPLAGGADALTGRLALAETAEVSLDVQYYIWHDDTSGILLLDALRRAAERGVRVRLLLDDNGVPGLDPYMAALHRLENFDIRLFNPSTVRSPKILGYAFDFFRMNRRMHNKSFIADGAAAIVGGRNIGDEYFRVGDDVFYVDLDVLAVGTVVADTARAFDAYWNSASVHAVDTVIDGSGDLAGFMARVQEVGASKAAEDYRDAAAGRVARYSTGEIQPEWTRVQLVVDDPAKGLGQANRDGLMITRLAVLLGTIQTRLDLVSAYFVPGQQGTEFFSQLAGAGVEVRILTNALNTTDVLMVHAGYTKYRRALLEAGVSLFELKLRGNMAPESETQLHPLGMSGASLHAKTFAVDDNRVFIGSFNFDPRSALLNCEIGFLIDSPTLASRVTRGFTGPIQDVSYQPGLTPEGRMIWTERSGEKVTVYQQEPGSSLFQQIAIVIIGLLPIEWLL